MFLMTSSPFSGGGGEASEASSCPVPAGGAATQRELRAGQQSHGARLFEGGVILISCDPSQDERSSVHVY